MRWWPSLRRNTLARWGALLLFILYLGALGSDFLSPSDPLVGQVNGALLPPTRIYWRDAAGRWLGPHVYPTTQGPLNLETGEQALIVDRSDPVAIQFLARGYAYRWLALSLPLPVWTAQGVEIKDLPVIPGIASDRHLFTTAGRGYLNLLGTDDQGRDQWSRLLLGSRISLSIGLVGIVITFPLGVFLGGLSGYLGGWVDSLLMRLVEVLMTIPSVYLLVALAAVLPPGLTSPQRFLLIVLITSLVNWAGLARVIRGQVLSIKEQTFVQAAQAMGASPLAILRRHVLPQTATYVVIAATLTVPSFIVAESVLSLIGLGIEQPDASWGNMLSLATNASILILQPWLVWPPALLIVLAVLAFNLVGDGLRDALDPRHSP
ncbi:MAG: ABC transporter permease [Gloeomargaritaceae cyanobacterium C42_A2020_066]|nr:ABC transporter permease [Gloeomargaritaceae cyanobacterium C42_A2020_066]